MKYVKNALALIATAMLLMATGAHAINKYCDPENPTLGCPGYKPPAAPAIKPIGPLYIFGTHNTLPTVLVYDTNRASLCSPNLTNCRPAAGLDALRRGTEFAVWQMLRWDRSGTFAINATEIIACFSYFDGPGGANFTCATAPRNGRNGYDLSVAATALGWQAYSGAGLAPLSAGKAGARFATRKQVTAYVAANGQLPQDRMHALEETAEPAPDYTYWERNIDPNMPEQELEEVVVIGHREDNGAPPTPDITFPDIAVAPPGVRDPYIVINPCVSFSACAAPPPPPPAPGPGAPAPSKPKVCTPECNAQGAVMSATCGATGAQLAATFGIIAPTAGIIAGVVGDPLLGYAVFKSIGIIGAGTTGAYGVACLGLNEMYKSQCLTKAAANGC